jgi:hypothetical protein
MEDRESHARYIITEPVRYESYLLQMNYSHTCTFLLLYVVYPLSLFTFISVIAILLTLEGP